MIAERCGTPPPTHTHTPRRVYAAYGETAYVLTYTHYHVLWGNILRCLLEIMGKCMILWGNNSDTWMINF